MIFLASSRGIAGELVNGPKFKAYNAHGTNFTRAKPTRRIEQTDEGVDQYLRQLDSAFM